VGVICVATFVLVLCYYFRCLKVMVGYLIFASVNLLGYSGGFMVMTAIQVWHIIADWATFGFIMWNFAIAGAVAVFWQKGFPRIITQGYLVLVSVIMSWIVTKLPEVRRRGRACRWCSVG
jgi:presenilin 1